MPFGGYLKTFSFKTFLLIFSLSVVSISVYGLANPKSSLAYFAMSGGECRFYYGNTSGQTQSLPVALSFCQGGSGTTGACMAGLSGKCDTAVVPGASGCTGGPPISISYIHPGGNTNLPPTGIHFDMGCGANWSDGANGVSDNLNIDFFSRIDKDYTSIRGSGGSQIQTKIPDGSRTQDVALSIMDPEAADYTVSHDFVFYPNCADEYSDARSADCFRKKTLPPLVIDNDQPTCSVSVAANGSNYDVTVTANDAGSGIAQMGLSYVSIDGNGNPIGGESPLVENFPTTPTGPNQTKTQTFPIAKSTFPAGQGFNAIAKVWDVKGVNNRDSGLDDSTNSVTCTTRLQCIMPTPSVSYLQACTPAIGSGFERVNTIRANALNAGGAYCEIDSVNLAHTNNFAYGNYFRNNPALPNNTPYLDMPVWMINPVNNQETSITPGATHYLMYWDADSQQVSPVTSFVARPACAKASVPVIVRAPLCSKPNTPDTDDTDLTWNAPVDKGGGNISDLDYDVQIGTDSAFTNIIATSSVSPGNPNNPTIGWDYGIFHPSASYVVGGNYYYRVRARGWGGYTNWTPAYGPVLLQAKPNAPTITSAAAYPPSGAATQGYAQIGWLHNITAGTQVSAVNGWTLRSSAGLNRNYSGNTLGVTDSPLPACDDTSYTYTLNGNNLCGSGPADQATVICPANNGPVCGPIQYRLNPSSPWINWPAAGITEPAGLSIQVQRTCTDPEVNPITYTWSNSCGTVSPASQTVLSGQPGVIGYNFPNVPNMSCNIQSLVRDSFNSYSDPHITNVIAKTTPAATLGTQTLTPGTRSIQRTNISDNWAVISGSTQNFAIMNYSVTGYSNLTAQGSSSNFPATATINTSTASFAAGINICNPTYGTCSFISTGTQTASNLMINSASFADTIHVTLNAAQATALRDILTDTGSPVIKFAVGVTLSSANTAQGGPISGSAFGLPPMVNNPPLCDSLKFEPSPAGSTATPVMTITPTIRDDWGLLGINVAYSLPATPTTFVTINNSPTYFNTLGNPRGASPAITWNLGSLTGTNRYNVRVNFTDRDNQTTICFASDGVTGSENPGGGPGVLPQVIIDKTVPVCSPNTVVINRVGNFLAFSVSGSDPVVNSVSSGLTKLDLTYQRTTAPAGPIIAIPTNEVIPANTSAFPYNTPLPYSNANGALDVSTFAPGTYNIVAKWTDRAGNIGSCNANYDKGSLISGRVRVKLDTNGTNVADVTGVPGLNFAPTSSNIVADPSPDNVIWTATGTGCAASYSGAPYAGTCDAHFTTATEFTATSAARIINLPVGTLAAPYQAMGRYSCTINVYSNNALVHTYTSNGAGGVCTVNLPAGDFTNGTAGNTSSGLWPTHVEFVLQPNSEQVIGRVWNSTGAIQSAGTYSVQANSVNGGTTLPIGAPYSLATAPAGSFRVPNASSADSSLYIPNVGAYANTTIHLNDTAANSAERLCVWAEKDDFAGAGAFKDFNSFDSTFNNVAKIQSIAQTQSLSGWTVDTSSSCDATFGMTRNGAMSPKYQHQVHFMSLPKVNITGTVYLVNNDSLCGYTDDVGKLTDPDNAVPGVTIPISVSFSNDGSATGSALNSLTWPGNVSQFDNGSNNQYQVFINDLPNTNFDRWAYTRSVNILNAADRNMYATCGQNSSVQVGNTIGSAAGAASYPATNQVTNNIVIYAKGANNWWQAYNGGVHGTNGIQDDVPNVDAAGEGPNVEIHQMIGNPTFPTIYAASLNNAVSMRDILRGYNAGGLVSTVSTDPAKLGGIGVVPGYHRGSIKQNWNIASGRIGQLRLPYTTDDPSTLAVFGKITDLHGSSSQWGGASDLADNQKIYIENSYTIGSPLQINGYQYLVVKGTLNINENIASTSANFNQTILIVASGDITIGANVSEINAMIYTPGNITILSAGRNSVNEKSLKIYGGLYAGKKVTINRDLQNTAANFGYPAVQVMYNPALIMNSLGPGFPSELKESNVYWINQ